MLDVGEKRAAHPADVDPAVLVEAPVLRRDDRLLHPGVDPVARHEHAALATAEDGEDRVTVGRVDVAVDLLLRRLLEGIEAAQLLAHCDDHAVGERRRPEHAQHADKRDEAELADPAPGPARSRRLGAFSAAQHGSRGIVSPTGATSVR